MDPSKRPAFVDLYSELFNLPAGRTDGQDAMSMGRNGAVLSGLHEGHFANLLHLEVPRSRLKFVAEVASGPLGVIKKFEGQLAGDTSTRLLAARMPRSGAGEKEENAFTAAMQTLGTLRHLHVVPLVGVVLSSWPPMALMEWMPNGTVVEALQAGVLLPARLPRAACDIARGMEYIAARRMVLRSLCARKCLVDAAGRVKVSGFQMTRSLQDQDYYRLASEARLPLRWLSPESIIALKFDEASDVYSYGVVLFELFTRGEQLPFAALPESTLLELLRSEQPLPALRMPSSTPTPIVALAQRCLARDRTQRPTFSGVVTELLDLEEGDRRWEFPRSQLTLIRELGSGQYGVVLQMLAHGLEPENGDEAPAPPIASAVVEARSAPRIVAVNLLREGATAAAEAEFMMEMRTMMALRHPNVISLLKVCTNERPLMLVLEYASAGALDRWLPTHGADADAETLLYLVHQVALGMYFLHGQRRIIHRDLAARNVLLTPSLTAKVADYGLARELSNTDYYRMQTSRPLPIRWMSPETLSEQRFSFASDVWAFGVLLFEVYSLGQVPFKAYSDAQLLEAARTGTSPWLEMPASAPPAM